MHYHQYELSLSEATSDKLSMGIACRKVGECHCELGDYEEAVEYQKRHLELSRQIGMVWYGDINGALLST